MSCWEEKGGEVCVCVCERESEVGSVERIAGDAHCLLTCCFMRSSINSSKLRSYSTGSGS
jgi:hypothetical protein